MMNYTNIEWTDFTWNPVTGCYHGCEYCYARKIVKRFTSEKDNLKCKKTHNAIETEYGPIWELWSSLFRDDYKGTTIPHPFWFEPTFHKYRLEEPCQRKKPAKIFVSSMGDLFGDWIPKEWIEQVIEVAEKCPQHTFQFLTKNPKRYKEFKFPNNCWLGTSVDGRDFRTDLGRAEIMEQLIMEQSIDNITFLSVEPLLGNVENHVSFSWCNWVIIGAETGPGAKKPKKWWVEQIFKNYRGPVFLKNNLNWHETIQEWPKGLVNNENNN